MSREGTGDLEEVYLCTMDYQDYVMTIYRPPLPSSWLRKPRRSSEPENQMALLLVVLLELVLCAAGEVVALDVVVVVTTLLADALVV